MENQKNSEENKNKLRAIYPKNNENLKNSKPNFTGSYIKKGCTCKRILRYG